MQTRGAIVRQAPGKYEVVDLNVDDPRAGEIQVKMVASGLCHSDDHIATGDIPVGIYPFAGGHEGAASVPKAGGTPKGREEATELAKQFTNGQGADQAIITVGVIKPEYVGQAMASIRKAGTVVVTALGNIADTAPLPVSLADVTLFQKRIQGSLFGASNPNWDILRQLDLYRSGVLKLDELVTKNYTLDEVAQGYQDMHDGKILRGVIKYS